MSENRLQGRVAIITGAAQGIGAAYAKALASEGAKICVADILDGENIAEEIRASGGKAFFCKTDVSDKKSVENMVREVLVTFSQIDILVNNAGITRDGLLMRMKDEDWDAVMDINLKAAFQLSRACIKGMMRRRYGRIISITSVVGVTGNPGQTNYAASKAGIIGFSKALAREVASRNITSNCIAPGFIETAMTDALNEKQKEAILTSIPAGRLGTVGEVASAAVYLASAEAAYMTGQTLHVNGGMAMI